MATSSRHALRRGLRALAQMNQRRVNRGKMTVAEANAEVHALASVHDQFYTPAAPRRRVWPPADSGVVLQFDVRAVT